MKFSYLFLRMYRDLPVKRPGTQYENRRLVTSLGSEHYIRAVDWGGVYTVHTHGLDRVCVLTKAAEIHRRFINKASRTIAVITLS